MKKLFLFVLIFSFTIAGIAQSEKYTAAMKAKVEVLDSIRTSADWLDAANTFERIAEAEKTQWLPYYYAAFGQIMHGYTLAQGVAPDAAKTDPLADKAEQLLAKAEAISKDNSEIFILKKMIATLRMMADPMNRWQTYGPIGAEALQQAKKLNPENPRVYYLEGMDKFYTPEEFGGSKAEAKTLFEESMKKYTAFKPESGIHPHWGLSQVQYYHSQIK
jgi:hypothetical protein